MKIAHYFIIGGVALVLVCNSDLLFSLLFKIDTFIEISKEIMLHCYPFESLFPNKKERYLKRYLSFFA